MFKTYYLRPHYTLTVTAILSQLGEQKPYFSITGEERYNRHHIRACGCLHELILKKNKGFQDLVDLHLSDIDGIPSHAAGNGLWWLLNGAEIFGKWSNADTEEKSLEYAAKHFRISLAEAQELRVAVRGLAPSTMAQKEFVQMYVDKCLPRWKAEADAAIEKYSLTVKKG